MKKKSYTVTGLGVLLGLVSLAAIILALYPHEGAWLSLKRTYTVYVLFDRGAEISPGVGVTVSGIPVGRVRSLHFADPDSLLGGVVAELAVERDHKLRRGSRARVVENLSGGCPRVEILPGPRQEAPLENGVTISGEVISSASALLSPELSSALDKSVAQVGNAADTLQAVLGDVRVILRPTTPTAVDRAGGPAGNLASAAVRLDATLSSVNAVLGDPTIQTELKETLHNLRLISEDGRETVASAREAFARARAVVADSEKLVAHSEETITRVDQRIDGLTQNLNRTLDLAAELLRAISPAAAKIGRGEGSLGKLIQDDELYKALLITQRRLAAEKQ